MPAVARTTRETRSVNTTTTDVVTKHDLIDTPGTKRKRKTSPEPTLKVVLPSSASLQQQAQPHPPAKIRINISPSKINGDAIGQGDHGNEHDHEPKRQKISLTLNGHSNNNNVSPDKASEDHPKIIHKGALSRDVRQALATIISRMALHLPAPLNGILTLWLPPDFKRSEENTLGFILRQDTLTWEQLVDTIHVFSENLLVPCQYPNPVPPRSQFRLPVPPLPSHFPPHAIYNFCAALHSLLLEIEPTANTQAQNQNHIANGITAERWALMQKTPHGGEWFTSAVNAREVERRKDGKQEATVLEKLAATGEHFGNAIAVSLQSTTGGESSRKNPTISESIIRKASLKMNRWKEMRAAKRVGGFGSITRGVTTPAVTSVSFTPTFGPTFDSTDASGHGYYSTIQGMHEHIRHREWSRRAFQKSQGDDEGWYGTDAKGKEKESVDDLLAENGEMIAELQSWQELRVRRGHGITERENAVADELLASLTRLTGHTSPAGMLSSSGSTSTSKAGLAHELARRFIPVSTPSIRGTLDPRRTHALHDNTTVRLRTPAGQTLGGPVGSGLGSTHNLTPKSGMPPPPIPQYMPPTSQQSYHSPSSAPAAGRYQPYGRSTPPSGPVGQPSGNNTIYGRTASPQQPIQNHQQTQNSTRPGPGPSALRQSFGPGPGPGPGIPGGSYSPFVQSRIG